MRALDHDGNDLGLQDSNIRVSGLEGGARYPKSSATDGSLGPDQPYL